MATTNDEAQLDEALSGQDLAMGMVAHRHPGPTRLAMLFLWL
ncbi:hypothetical protein [Ktedonospora formicarum]|nr:hypothetical protein [Ktedonospora formicarum]